MATFQRINGLIDISSRNRSVFQVSVAVRKAADLRIPLLIGNAVFACLFNEIFKIGLAHGAHFRCLIRFRSTSFGGRWGRRTSLRTTGYRATATITSLPGPIVSQLRHYKTFLALGVYTPNFHTLGQPTIFGKLTELAAWALNVRLDT